MEKELVYNTLQTPDGTIIESKRKHDFVSYIDSITDKMYFIDGGLDYVRSSNNGDEIYLTIYSDQPYETVREFAFRAGFGKDGKEEYKITRFKDMTDNHLNGAIEYVSKITKDSVHYQLLLKEQQYRIDNNIKIDE